MRQTASQAAGVTFPASDVLAFAPKQSARQNAWCCVIMLSLIFETICFLSRTVSNVAAGNRRENRGSQILNINVFGSYYAG